MKPLTGWLILSRRRLLGGLSAVASLSMAPFISVGAKAADEASFETFYALSLLVTGRASLDIEFARKLYDVFRGEPWSAKHIALSYEKLSGAANSQSAEKNLEQNERWFVSHLRMSWYTGVYYYDGQKPLIVAYEKALMWDAVAGMITPPLVTAYGPDWAHAPIKT